MRELEIKETDRILIVSPHPDDESMGCGGMISKYGPQIDVVIVTDGAKGHEDDMSDEECALIRRNEAENALREAGIHESVFLQIPDKGVSAHYPALKALDLRPYQYIFVPNRRESHLDHRACYQYIKRLTRRQKSRALLAEYEVWTPLVCPNYYLNIDEEMPMKKRMVAEYKSQLSEYDYITRALALSMYRGAGLHIQYAEAYEIPDKFNLLDKICLYLPVYMAKKMKRLLKMRRA